MRNIIRFSMYSVNIKGKNKIGIEKIVIYVFYLFIYIEISNYASRNIDVFIKYVSIIYSY